MPAATFSNFFSCKKKPYFTSGIACFDACLSAWTSIADLLSSFWFSSGTKKRLMTSMWFCFVRRSCPLLFNCLTSMIFLQSAVSSSDWSEASSSLSLWFYMPIWDLRFSKAFFCILLLTVKDLVFANSVIWVNRPLMRLLFLPKVRSISWDLSSQFCIRAFIKSSCWVVSAVIFVKSRTPDFIPTF